MAYHEYDWACRDASPFWRWAEIQARMCIGLAWSAAVWALLLRLFPSDSEWVMISLLAIGHHGIHLATPRKLTN